MSQAIRTGFRVFFILGFFLNVHVSFSQDKEVADVIKEASELFVNQQYSEAKDLYSQLVSLYPKDPNFNYRFGACLIAVDEDKTYPLKFLEYAVSRPNVDIDAFYFLGKGYHYNYRFDEAIQYFNKYKNKLDVKSKAVYPVDQDIRFCENGKLLLRDISTPLVIKKSKVSIADFFTSFKISEMGGRMMYAPKELHTATDKKKGYTPVMYKNSNSNFVYYSSYGPNDKNGLDLYKVHVSDAGVIGKPVRLPDNINTPYDERFPFLTKDESKFYFSSTGLNSMGGADIFVASHDSVSQVFGAPVNLDYSINTPDDDFMYAELGGNSGIAFFASTRNSEKGKAFVYKINAKRKAVEIAVLAGFFNSDNTKSCKITVEDLDQHKVVSTFNTNKKNGEYVMRLRNGGKYSFLVEPYGGDVAYKGRVDLPHQENIKVLRQEIEIVKDDAGERLIIRNLFEEAPEAEDAQIIAQVLVENANIKEEKPAEITLSPDEMVASLEKDKSSQKKLISDLESKRDASYVLANQKRELAHKDLELADQLEKQIDLNDVSKENRSRQKEFASLVQDARNHTEQAEAAFEIGQKFEEVISDIHLQINETEGYIVRVQGAKEENDGAALNDLFTNYTNDKTEFSESLVADQVEKEVQSESELMKQAIKKANRISEEQQSIKQEISTAKAEKLATKKKKEKDQIQSTIEVLESEIAPLEKERNTALANAVVHEKKVAKLLTEQNMVKDVKSDALEISMSVTEEQKSAMLASIEATSSEILALENITVQMSEVMEAGSEVADSTEDILEGDSLSGNEIAINDNLETDVENEPSNSSETEFGVSAEEELTVEGEPLATDVDNENEVNSEEETTAVNGELTAVGGLESVTPIGNSNTPVTEEEEEEDPLVESEANIQPTVSQEDISGNDSEYFAYTTEYEVPVDDVILVDGQSIPLEITSNTGKQKYTPEELKNAPILFTKSGYNTSFDEQYEEVKQNEDPLAKAKATQQLNYNWVVAIEKEVAELSYAKENSESEAYNSRINAKVEELKDQASQKRNFMALNARIIKQLEGQLVNNMGDETEIEMLSDSMKLTDELVLTEDLNQELVAESDVDQETELSRSEDHSNSEITETNSEVVAVAVDPNESELIENATVVEGNEEFEVEEVSEANRTPHEGISVESSIAENTGSKIDSLQSSIEVAAIANEENNIDEQLVNQNSALIADDTSSNEIAQLSPIQEAQISPTAAVVTQIEIEKENQQVVVQTSINELSELETQLGETKKKKKRKVLEAEMVNKKAEVAYQNQKLALIATKRTEVEKAQSEMVKDPLTARPSLAKFSEARKHEIRKDELQSELEDLEFQLSETKKKKKRVVIDAEIIEVKRKIESEKLESQMANETALEMQRVEIETLKSLTPYGEEVLVKLPQIENEMSTEQFNEVKELEAFISYMETKTSSEKEIQAASVMYQSAKNKQIEVAKMEEEISLLKEGLSLLTIDDQAPVQAEIEEKRAIQKRFIAEAEVLYQEAKSMENEAYYSINEANAELLVLDNARERTLIFTAVNGNIQTKIEEIAFDSTNIDAIPSQLTTDIFVDSDSTFYDETKPIPMDVELPKGVILKVQIGAFRNPINQATFKGFAPIVGEVTPSGLTRYTAGLFKDFETANGAKDGIRAKGYSDAFIVAYLDGKRISISEARRVLAGDIDQTEVVVQNEISVNEVPQTVNSVPVTEISSKPLLPGNGDIEVAATSTRDELFFTVQVGVYSRTIQPGSVLALTPLNSENIPNNLVRYSSGVYGSVAKANVARNKIIQTSGISDAFITAYYKGSRIPLSEAKSLVANQVSQSAGNSSSTNNESVMGSSTKVSEEANSLETERFYVTIGPYTGGIPIEEAREILAINALGVVVEKNNGATLYKIGNFTNRQEAEALKVDLASKGLNNPTVHKNEE